MAEPVPGPSTAAAHLTVDNPPTGGALPPPQRDSSAKRDSSAARSSNKQFRPANYIRSAEFFFSTPGHISRPRSMSGAQRAGVRYEQRAHDFLLCSYPGNYLPSPWLRFKAIGDLYFRYCQPDGLLFDFTSGHIIIVEVKLRHTTSAHRQVRHLYQPVLQFLFPSHLWQFSAVEITPRLNPDWQFPEDLHIISEDDVFAIPKGAFGVYLWRPT